MVISTGMTLPRCDSVAALYCLQKSMMLTPCGPSAVPTGGAGVAAPALSCTLTTAAIFFFLGAAISCCPYLTPAWYRSDLGDLVKRKLDRGLPAEDRYQDFEFLGIGVDLVHGSRERGERTVHYRNRFAHRKFHGGPRDLRLHRCLLRLGSEQRGHLAEAERGRPAGQADEPGDAGGVADNRPGLVGEVHPDEDVAGQHLFRDLLPLAALDLHHLVHGDLDLEDVVLHVQRLDAAFQVGLHPVLVARVRVDHVPLAGQLPQLGREPGHRVELAGTVLVALGPARTIGVADGVRGVRGWVPGTVLRGLAGHIGIATDLVGLISLGLFRLVEFTDHVGLTYLAVCDRSILRLTTDVH